MSENKFTVNKNNLHLMAQIMKDLSLNEIEIKVDEVYIRFSKDANSSVVVKENVEELQKENCLNQAVNLNSLKEFCISSPVVGRAYLSPKPGDAPFIKVGDIVEKGQVVLLIEAMKVMNNVKASKAGVVKKILVDNEDPVEYGQPLILLE